MDDGLKQRIIGAFVLIALIVIFVPVLFDENRVTPVDRATRIPIEPEMEKTEIVEVEKPVIVEEAPKPEDAFIPDETKPQTLREEEPGLAANGLPKAWVLQLASFDEKKRAESLRDTLLAEGYDAYIREVDTSKGKKNRLYVGPKLDKNALIKEKEAIDEKYKLSAIILQHQ